VLIGCHLGDVAKRATSEKILGDFKGNGYF
jgi:hypothetical protein